jgi:hypothetical protein
VKATSLLALCGLCVVASCGNDVTPPDTIGESGSLSLSFAGAGTSGTSTFSATGAVPSSVAVSFGSKPWAAGAKDDQNQNLVIFASVPKSSSIWDYITLNIVGQGTGSRTVISTCTSGNCNAVSMVFGSNQSTTNFQYLCSLTSGTIAVASVTATRITGTFSGTGDCFSSSGASSPFSIANGTFDVGIYSGKFR